MNRVICISGKAQNGKDTSAAIIKETLESRGYKVLIAHYADLVKYICKTFFGWDGLKDEVGRTILQKVGTDVVRKKDEDFWVKFIINILIFFDNEWNYVVIPDARFPNEIRALNDAGFDVTHVRVIRDNYATTLTKEQQLHPSETALDGIKPDYVLHNNSTIENLAYQITSVVDQIIANIPDNYYQMTIDDITNG